MAESNPTLAFTDVPDEVPPGNRFDVTAEVRQGGPDPWASDGSCTSRNLDVAAWKTPVKLRVDGEIVDEEELCLASGNSRETTLSGSVDAGKHEVAVEVYAVGGNAYDLKPMKEELNAETVYTVTATEDAPDPSRPGPADTVMRYVQKVASALGVSAKYAAVLMALAIALLLLLPG